LLLASVALRCHRRRPPRSPRSDINCWSCISQLLFLLCISFTISLVSSLKNTYRRTQPRKRTRLCPDSLP
jgi:hypothetical protein